ncbi:MAG TPA: ATP-binding protein [Candidatus Dormibacteraeota bacterium]|nr:ATP-binding protein [Candidatus Dormibacteraeota bacterium]
MSVVRKRFLDLPVAKKLVVILWLFLLIVVSLLGLSYVTIENLSAARAYVGGEGLWSKAQKQAVYDLLQYSISHSDADYQNYGQALLVPLGDKQARAELEKPVPDMRIVRIGFIQGRNSPQDVEGMATLFRRFRHSQYMSEAVDIWAQADALIEQLQRLGDSMHAEISSGRADRARVAEIARQVDVIGNQLTPLEDRFSYALGAGARQAKGSFLLVTFGATATSLVAGLLFTFFMLRHIRQTEERYKHLIDTANDVILVLDAETGVILDANERSSQFLGRPLREIVGIRGEQIVPEGDREEYRKVLDGTLKGAAVAGRQLHLSHSDGRSITVEVNTSLTEFEGKSIVQGIFRDITERQRLEEEVRQAQKMEVVGRLAGGIAHDFNNLLMVILTQVSKVRSLPSRAQLLEHADRIRTAAEKAALLTKQLLAFGRKQVLVLQVLDLNALLGEVKEMLSTLPAQQVQLMVTPSPQPLPVEVDPGKIEQVIMNLAVNACDAMPSGGILRIKTSQVSMIGLKSRVKSSSTAAHALLEITDTGCGMDAETKAHLFEPFFTTKPIGKGTGLGLSTVYGIVKQSGGTIEVDSLPGEGTTFRVYLPIVERQVSPRKTAKVPIPVTKGSETVLLAEDQSSIRSVLRELLESKGYQVLEAQNGGEALELAERHTGSIDVLVTDVIMPQIRGIELAKRVTDLHPDICVIFMSGYSEDALLENRLLSQQNITLIQKPFDPEDLAQKIRESLNDTSEVG